MKLPADHADNINFDVIIPSNYKTRAYTNSSINQLKKMSFYNPNIIVVDDSELEEWGYNKALNIGASKAKSNILFFANNDLKYTKHWDRELIDELDCFDSVSPYCSDSGMSLSNNKIEIGYIVGKHIAGWAIMMHRRTFNAIGGFDEDFTFWCCDNAYAEQLKRKRLNHALIKSSKVKHIGSKTLGQIKDKSIRNELTLKQVKKFNRKYRKNLFNLGK